MNIIKKLIEGYDSFKSDKSKDLPLPGYSKGKITFEIQFDKKGKVVDVLDIRESIPITKKGKITNKPFPTSLTIPQAKDKTRELTPFFLWDNGKYILDLQKSVDIAKGTDKKEYFESSCILHNEILKENTQEEAVIIKKFFNMKNTTQRDNVLSILKNKYADLGKKGFDIFNFVFKIEGSTKYFHDLDYMKKVWDAYYKNSIKDNPIAVSLVDGVSKPIALLHPKIKGLSGQSTGGSLIGFNDEINCSYGKKNGLNAAVGVDEAHSYATFFSHLLNDENHNIKLGKVTYVFWSNNKKVDQSLSSYLKNSKEMTSKEVFDLLNSMKEGISLQVSKESTVDNLYIIGVVTNSARIVRVDAFEQSIDYFVENSKKHIEDISMIDRDNKNTIPALWHILSSLHYDGKLDNVNPKVIRDYFRSMITGQKYPQELLNVIQRLKRSNDKKRIKKSKFSALNPVRLKLLKGLINRNFKGGIMNTLDETREDVPYLLGRELALYVKTQVDGSGNLNASVEDKFYASAMTTPSKVFPYLRKLSVHHISKMKRKMFGWGEKRNREISNLVGRIPVPYPNRLNDVEQSIFMFGYAQQMNWLNMSKDEKEVLKSSLK